MIPKEVKLFPIQAANDSQHQNSIVLANQDRSISTSLNMEIQLMHIPQLFVCRGSQSRLRFHLYWMLLVLLALSTWTRAQAESLINYRGGNSVVLSRSSYDYVPTVMLDGKYRMWWCGGNPKDDIMYSEASALSGPWSTPRSVFKASGIAGTFDKTHTCDPSIIRVNGTYYMYYGGLPEGEGLQPTRIGVAVSSNGINWSRLNNGQPIITPQNSNVGIYLTNGNPCDDGRTYGAGQPSATYLNGYFYLIYTDTTGNASNACNGAAQYVIRSTDPVFQSNVEVRTAAGFAPRTLANQTSYSVLEAFSVDWLYSDVLDRFVVASHNVLDVINLNHFDPALNYIGLYQITASWREGPGLAKTPEGHAPPSPQGLSRVPFDVMRAVGTPDVGTWNLAYVGIDLETNYSLSQLTINNKLGRTLEGFRLEISGLPMTVVREGRRLQFQLVPPALRLSRNVYRPSSDVFHAVPYAASLYSGNYTIGASGRPAAFVLDDNRKWPVSCIEIVTDNNSSVAVVSVAQFDAIPSGPSLFCLK